MNETKVTYDFPTEVIDLPSKGLIYPKDHPLASGQIEIKYMTAKEEDILSSKNLIKKGVVLDKLFESIIVTPNVNSSDIYIGDKNAIILATRLLGYGAEYKLSFYSSKLDKVMETEIDLSSVQIKDVDYSKFNHTNNFEFETPIGKNKLTFKLLTHGDEIAIEKDITALEKISGKEVSSDITTRLRYMITSVDGKSDIGSITKYVNGMLVRDSRAFRNYIREISPDLDMMFTYTYDDGEEDVLPITLGVNFFWPSE
jgi:hypothetical protein